MIRRTLQTSALLGGVLLLVSGCSSGAGIRIGSNLFQKDSHLKISLDGQEARQNTLQKAASGYSRYNIKEVVGTRPTLSFQVSDPEKFGRITTITVSIFEKFESGYSNQAEFTLTARDINNPHLQFQQYVKYDLGRPGPNFRVTNLYGKEVPGVTLKSGMEYMLSLAVKADKSETAQVYFKTK